MGAPRGWVALAESLSTRCTAAGIRPARAGNFLLSRQKKVTKEEALNRTLLQACAEPRAKAPARILARGEPLRSRRCPYHRRHSFTVTPPDAGCTPGSRMAIQASLGRRVVAHGVFTGEPGVQPALTGPVARCLVLFTATAASAQRFASGHRPSVRSRARALATARWRAASASLLVTFLWQDREKLPALAGRIPAAVHRAAKALGKSNPSPRAH